jgi:competence protein ComEC
MSERDGGGPNYRGIRAMVVALALAACATRAQPTTAAHPVGELPPGPSPSATAQLRIHLIDVGQGAATLVEFSCGVVLVDTGGEQNRWFNSEARLVEYLDRFFRTRPHLRSTIALLVLTHPHIDHTRSAMAVFERYHVQNVATNGVVEGSGGEEQGFLIDAAARAHIGVQRVRAADIPPTGLHDRIVDPISCPDGDPDIRVFWGAVASSDVDWDHGALANANNDSIVIRFRLGAASFLISGDLELDGIGEVVKRFGSELRSVVWQVGHHGSWNATTTTLLEAIDPALALIAMGNVDRQDRYSAWAYGHPRVEAIELLEHALSGARREAIHVSIGTGHEQFVPHVVTAPIYATGWDGDVRVTLHARDGSIFVGHSFR